MASISINLQKRLKYISMNSMSLKKTLTVKFTIPILETEKCRAQLILYCFYYLEFIVGVIYNHSYRYYTNIHAY